ncbi:uncharacterized protein LOC115681127 [Syzygium oleosum]|uniref:uncharacterized protein LOC115681127 n=1 Tax=Syzygium oleosum TaxID=219896 RepID=UPI0024BA162F|nr:uncharacterized protein LOC115681127 [Syzygium oleosum]
MNRRGAGAGGSSSSQISIAKYPRMEGVLRVLEGIGNLMDRQAQERANATAQAAEAVAALVNENSGDPEAASKWVEELEKAFALLGCTEAEKVTLAMYQLQGNANDWWKATQGRVFPTGVDQNWTTFVQAFNEKYFSVSARERKMTAFVRLQQNQMTVDQYEAKFARLSKFAPRMVDHPEDKARRFRDGLRADICSQLIPVNLRTYEELYERAQAIEHDMTDRAAASRSRYTSARDNRQ